MANKKKIAMIFSGQGSQAIGMGKDFYENSDLAKEMFDKAGERIGVDFKELIFEENEKLAQTAYTQPAILLIQIIAYKLFKDACPDTPGVKKFAGCPMSVEDMAAKAAAEKQAKLDAELAAKAAAEAQAEATRRAMEEANEEHLLELMRLKKEMQDLKDAAVSEYTSDYMMYMGNVKAYETDLIYENVRLADLVFDLLLFKKKEAIG